MPHVDCVWIDGPNLAHRAWHGAGADPYKASVTLTAMVRSAIAVHTPRFACVAFDAPTCFRTRIFPGYKKNRLDKPGAMADWLEALRGLERIAGARVTTAPDCEADDVLATLAGQCRAGMAPLYQHLTCLLATSDQDAYALVGGCVVVGLLSSGFGARYVSARAVREKLGVPPWLVPYYKALVGDASDDVPGVAGIGPKKAVQLLAPYAAQPRIPLDVLRDACDRVGEVLRSKDPDEAYREAVRAWRVVRLREDAPLRHALGDLRVVEPE